MMVDTKQDIKVGKPVCVLFANLYALGVAKRML